MGVKITDTTMRDGHQSLLATRKELIKEYRRSFANPYIAASRGLC